MESGYRKKQLVEIPEFEDVTELVLIQLSLKLYLPARFQIILKMTQVYHKESSNRLQTFYLQKQKKRNLRRRWVMYRRETSDHVTCGTIRFIWSSLCLLCSFAEGTPPLIGLRVSSVCDSEFPTGPSLKHGFRMNFGPQVQIS